MTRKLQVWSPFRDLWDLHDEIDRLFYRSGRGRRGRRGEEEGEIAVWAPAVDICDDKEAVKITAELPGMKREEVKISVDDGALTIKGERRFTDETKKDNYHCIERSYGTFYRSFSLPPTVDADKIKATMKDGVLEILIPKKEEAKPKSIEIEVK